MDRRAALEDFRRSVRQDLVAALESVITTLGRQAAPGELQQVTDSLVTADCVHSALNAREPFVESATTASIRLGRAALRDEAGEALRGSEDAPAERLRRAMANPELLDDPGLGQWLCELTPAAEAMVFQQALGWMVDTLALVPAATTGQVQWCRRNLQARLGGQGAVFRVRVDAVRRTGGGFHLFRTQLRPGPGDGALVRRIALVAVLSMGDLPEGVVLGYRETLTKVRHDPTTEWLPLAIDEAAEAWRHVLSPARAPTNTGRHCGYCVLNHECGPGSEHLRNQRNSPLGAVVDTAVALGSTQADPGSDHG